MKKVVVVGGGTGNYTVLKCLKSHGVDLSAVVSMADDGGSTGILRDELGVLPPGDVRQCLVALSDSSETMRSLMNYRFEQGGLGGHSFGNLLLSALEKVTGSFEHAVEEVGKILFIRGKVIPVTTHKVRLKMVLKDDRLLEGEKEIYLSRDIERGYKHLYLDPFPTANPHAIQAIGEADLIVIGPGGLHTSIIPNLLVSGISTALKEAKGKKVFIVNLMNRLGQTAGYGTSHYIEEMSRFIGEDIFDYVFVNNQYPPEELMQRYAEEGELVSNDLPDDERVVTAPFLGQLSDKTEGDRLIHRSLIRHDPEILSHELMNIVNCL
ncbi:MAG: YvcK family protein [Simkaniaceae bacterium]|nr:YvcK family protein [Simkaniaceae bacterium]